MLAVLSPAKTLDFESCCPAHRPTKPQFLADASELIATLRKKSRPALRELMNISEPLAELNYQRYRDWNPPFTADNARAALLAFKGDVYTGFDLKDYTAEDFKTAQKRIRILSGLYGLLRPLDLIQPYRLEMGTALPTKRGKNLYEFWGDTLTSSLGKALRESGSDVLVNLASNEYFSAIQPSSLKASIIVPQFRDLKNGKYKFLSFYGKKARGMMADYIVRERIERPEDLKKFDRWGYRFNKEMSSGSEWFFTRDEVPAAA